jgi:hypothetical protein
MKFEIEHYTADVEMPGQDVYLGRQLSKLPLEQWFTPEGLFMDPERQSRTGKLGPYTRL